MSGDVGVVCFGEVLLCVKSDDDTSRQCTMDYGGSEFTVAVGCGTLGRQVRFVSVVPGGHLGTSVLKIANDAGVDTSHVTVDDAVDSELGMVITTGHKSVYQRRHSSFCRRVDGREYDWTSIFKNTGAFVTSAITPSISEPARAAWVHSIKRASLAKIPVVLNLNWTPSVIDFPLLWQAVKPVIHQVTLLTLSEQALTALAILESIKMSNKPDTKLKALAAIRHMLRVPMLAICFERPMEGLNGWQYKWSAVAYQGHVVTTKATPVQHRPIESRGGSDAWLAGFVDEAISQNLFGSKHTQKKQVRTAARKGDILSALSQEKSGPLCAVPRAQLVGAAWDENSTVIVGMAADLSARKRLDAGLKQCPFIPVIKLDDSLVAGKLAEVLASAGVKAMNIDCSADNADSIITEVLKAVPSMIVGGARVTTPERARNAIQHGAAFLTSPACDPELVSLAAKLGVPLYPGVATATEVSNALKMNMQDLIFFPAEQLGGLQSLRELAQMYPAVRWIPAGGIDSSRLKGYLMHPNVITADLSWDLPKHLINEGNWDELRTHVQRMIIEVWGRAPVVQSKL
eukprot:TRINITY_DN304_c2_g1_i1.p1 TRINITY_DN304_c2_g1~~TRINITY_DN304_c2_g1_i1.p1  ORF type:complete len:572 (+),score=87.90 TRINITY_DN304_c2_g1_i1:147-1862(+)